MKVQWDVIWSVLRTLCVAGGPAATLLIALGFPPVEVSTDLAIVLGAVGVLSVVVPGLRGAFLRTDKAKVAAVPALPAEAKVQVAALLPDETKVAAAAAVPGAEVAIDPKIASPAVVAVAKDDAQPSVILKT